MLTLRFSDQSQKDLGEIWDYIADDNVPAANRMVERLIATCDSFIDTPSLGRRREEFRAGLRSLPVGNYVIFYRIESDRVHVLRILHGARELEKLMANEYTETFEAEN